VIEWLYNLDVNFFRLGNEALANPVFDAIMPFITDVRHWYVVYILSVILLMIYGGKRGRWAVVFAIMTIVISDQLSSFILKPLIGRLRPCHALDHVRLLVRCGGGFSFPSSHAVNNFAIALFFGSVYRKAMPYLLLIAFIIAYSRVYVGVHYFSDVIAGAFIGAGIGYLVALLYTRLIISPTTVKSHS